MDPNAPCTGNVGDDSTKDKCEYERDYYDFIRYTQSTQGHLNSQGLCFIDRRWPAPGGGSGARANGDGWGARGERPRSPRTRPSPERAVVVAVARVRVVQVPVDEVVGVIGVRHGVVPAARAVVVREVMRRADVPQRALRGVGGCDAHGVLVDVIAVRVVHVPVVQVIRVALVFYRLVTAAGPVVVSVIRMRAVLARRRHGDAAAVQLARRAAARSRPPPRERLAVALLLLQLGYGCEPSGPRLRFPSENVPKRRPQAHAGREGGRPVRPAEELTNALRAAGLRRTTPRIAVLQHLEAATGPISHGEIAEKLAPAGYDRATVYRNLMDLFQVGLVTRTDLGDHVWRFELVRGGGEGKVHAEHPHFLCTDCGDVACLPDDAVRFVSTRGVPRAVGKNAVEVQVKGRCDACAR